MTPLEQKVLSIEISNLQDIFIITKSWNILKNKMATMGIFLSAMKQCVDIYPLPPLAQMVLWAELSNLSFWEYVWPFLKNKMATMGVDSYHGVLYILRLLLIYGKLNVFMVDIFTDI